jgi:uncharacterized protein
VREQSILLFDRRGSSCTVNVLKAVQRRIHEGGITHVVVASTTGETALRTAEILSQEATIVCVTGPPSWSVYPEYQAPRPDPAVRRSLEESGVKIVETTISSFGDSVDYSAARFGAVPASWLVAETLVAVGGYGLKTAVEATIMATDAGAVPPFVEVVAVAGTDRGADTAAVLLSTYAMCFFSLEAEKRFQVKEILAMPRNKMWYREISTGADWLVQERKPAHRQASKGRGSGRG